MMNTDMEIDGVYISKEKGDEIIKEIISCLRGQGITIGQAKFLLEETSAELYRTKLT